MIKAPVEYAREILAGCDTRAEAMIAFADCKASFREPYSGYWLQVAASLADLFTGN